MSLETAEDISISGTDKFSDTNLIPYIDEDRFTSGYINAYEVVDHSEDIEISKDPIRIYTTNVNRSEENLSYSREIIACYESYNQGISQSEKEAHRAERVKKSLLAGAGATGIFTAVEYKNIFDDTLSSKDNREQVIPGVLGVLTTFVLIAGAWIAKDTRTRAKNRKIALEGASKSSSRRFLSNFNTKL